MAKFVINGKLYDTEKMQLIGHVQKWYEFTDYMSRRLFGEGIAEKEAKALLLQYDYAAYAKMYGDIEEA